MTPDLPRAIVSFFASLEAKDFAMLSDILVEDAEQRMPFAPRGLASEFCGRTTIVAHFESGMRTRRGLKFAIKRSFFDVDKQSAIVEFTGESVLEDRGVLYRQTYISVFDLKDGKIERITQYFDPNRILDAFGDFECAKEALKL